MAALANDARVLRDALEHLDAMAHGGEKASDRVHATPAQRNYLESWVLPYLQAVLNDLEGTEPLPEWMRRDPR